MMIQDIAPYEYDNQYKNMAPEAEDYAVITLKQEVLLKKNEEAYEVPCVKDISKDAKFTYLFSISEKRFFLAMNEDGDLSDELLKEGYEFFGPRGIRFVEPRWIRFAMITALQLNRWYRANRFCGCCGKELKHDSKERMMRCEHCGNMVYPKICPAVITAVCHEDNLLVTKYANAAPGNHFALIAGFAEVGETIEECVKREVMEETGVAVKRLKFYKSQPWSFSDTLLMGFYCELEGPEKITMDAEELSVAKWLHREKVPTQEDGISLTAEMINRFKELGQKVFD